MQHCQSDDRNKHKQKYKYKAYNIIMMNRKSKKRNLEMDANMY